MSQIATDYEPKAGSQLHIETFNIERDEVVDRTVLDVVEGDDGQLTARPASGPQAETPGGEAEGDKKSKGKGGSAELEIAKFVWEFIKDNKPVAQRESVTTSVLHEGTKGLDYHGAVAFMSDTFRYRMRDATIKDLVIASCDLRLEGMHRAVPSRDGIPDGHYLPSIYFNVLEMNVPFSFKLSASADVTPAANVGTAEKIQPRLGVYAKLDLEWLFVSHPTSAHFGVDGLRGAVLGYFSSDGRRI